MVGRANALNCSMSSQQQSKKLLEHLHPNLRSSYYKLSSPEDHNYNCIAFAADDLQRWWDPSVQPYVGRILFWPGGFPRDWTLNTLSAIFESLGYRACDSGLPESGFEKVALYGTNGIVKHAAKQPPGRDWCSKMGALQDIRHKTLTAVAGTVYGDVLRFLKRAAGSA